MSTSRPARIRTRTSEVGARDASPLHHRPVQASGRPGSNGPPRVGSPVLFRLSYVRMKEPPAGVEPALQPYEGCVLPLTPQRPESRGALYDAFVAATDMRGRGTRPLAASRQTDR